MNGELVPPQGNAMVQSDWSELKLQHLGLYNVSLFLTLTVVTPLNLLGELVTHSLCWWPKSPLELLIPLQMTKLVSVSVNFFQLLIE